MATVAFHGGASLILDNTANNSLVGSSRFSTGDDRLVSPRQVAEIEHRACNAAMQFTWNAFQKFLVIAVQKHDVLQAGIFESLPGIVQRQLLNVEREDRSA